MSKNVKSKKVKDVIKALQADGWYIDRTNKHHIMKHPTKHTLSGMPMTVSKHMNEDLDLGTYKSIMKDAGLK